MEGDAARRFCGVCSKHVHNLSAMNVDDADELLRASAGQELCVRYQAESDGMTVDKILSEMIETKFRGVGA